MSNFDNPYASPQTPFNPNVPPPGSPPPGSKPYAPCPRCRNIFAKPVGFTWWGGALGPWLFTHVRCVTCGEAYNGKTGQSNNTAIAIYFAVSAVIGLIVGLLPILLSARR
jgi:hypothetical protein